MKAESCCRCCIAPWPCIGAFLWPHPGRARLAAKRRGGTPGFSFHSFGALFFSLRAILLAGSCAEARSTKAPLSTGAGPGILLRCAREGRGRKHLRYNLHSGRTPLLTNFAGGGLDRTARRWRNARKRAAAKASQPGVKGSVGCGGMCHCYGSLLVTCGRRRSSVCSRLLRSIKRLPLQPQQS